MARAAATGGGRTYRGQAPVRWYASLVLIFLLGVTLVVYSRYENSHPVAATQPAINTHWFASLAIDVCGNVQSNLAANPNSQALPGLTTQGDGVIRIQPTSASDAGNHATLARFVQEYPGLTLTSSTLKLPNTRSYKNGSTCPAGTKDAHKRADVLIQAWSSPSGPAANSPTTFSNPSSLKFGNGQLITIAFVPAGASVPKPSGTTISTMLSLISQAATSTTTTAPSSSTTAPASSSTTAPSSSTTGPTGTTTATTSASTTTSKP